MEWHVWDFPDNIRVYFNDSFRELLYSKLKGICKTRIEIARRLGTDKETIRRCFYLGFRDKRKLVKTYTSVKLIKKIIEVFGFYFDSEFLQNLEKNIIAYRSWNGWDVTYPNLPIRETPELYSVVFHVVGDGNASPRHSPYYSNKCKELINEFENHLQIFGNVEIKLKIREDGLIYLNFPKVITDILSYILKTKFTHPTNLPQRIFFAPIECKIAAVKAFIDDEGCVSTSFCIIQKSKRILLELKKILEMIDIKTGKICNYSTARQLYISVYSYEKFANLITLSNPKKNSRLIQKIKNFNHSRVNPFDTVISHT